MQVNVGLVMMCVSFNCFFAVTGAVRKARIIGGDESNNEKVPWQVRIFMLNVKGEKFTCGGSLISKYFVLTAAHCVIGHELYQLIFGDKEDEQIKYVTKDNVFPHPNYNEVTYEYDIGLIRLPSEVILSDDVYVVGLPCFSDVKKNYSRKFAITSGWGRTNPQPKSESNVLKVLTMQIVEYEKCPTKYKTKLCATGKGLDTICKGDSGGPLVIYDQIQGPVVIGITSVVINDCKEGLPAFFTRVSLFLNWIRYITNIHIYK